MNILKFPFHYKEFEFEIVTNAIVKIYEDAEVI